MSFFSYFLLRAAQQVLCVSYSVPVAIKANSLKEERRCSDGNSENTMMFNKPE